MLLQQLLVGFLVAACALYSTWRLLTARARLRALDALAVLPGAAGSAWLTRLRSRVQSRLAAGCAGCGGAATPGAAAGNRTPGGLRR